MNMETESGPETDSIASEETAALDELSPLVAAEAVDAPGLKNAETVEVQEPAAPKPAADGADSDADVVARLVSLEQAMEASASALGRIETRLDEVVRLGTRSAAHVDALHAENQRLRGGEVAQATAPMVRDLIRLHDDLVKLVGASSSEAIADLDITRQSLLGVLQRWGVEPFEPEQHEPFDSARHQGVGRIDAPGVDDGTIATVRRCGFASDDGRVVRPAEVEVYHLVEVPVSDKQASSDSAPTTNPQSEQGAN